MDTERVTGWLREKGKAVFSLDRRSLAVFRIMMGFTTLFDIADRLRDLQAHYSDDGIMSRQLVMSHFTNYQWISAYMMVGTEWGTLALFLIHAVVGFCMMVGYRSKLMSILNWFLVISLHDRNYIVLHGGDILQRVLMFFGMFLPLGDCFSVDAAMAVNDHSALDVNLDDKKSHRKQRKDMRVCNMASIAFTVQLMAMYWVAHRMKTGKEWREDFTSAWLALQLDFFRRPIGDFLLLFSFSLPFFTWAVLHWQNVGVYLYFSPFLTGPLKAFSVLGFFFMHFAFFLALRLGQFGWCTCGGILALVPTWCWDSLDLYIKTKERTDLELYYADSCNQCLILCRALKSFLLVRETRIRKASHLFGDHEQSEKSFAKRNYWLIVKEHNGQISQNFKALAVVIRRSPVFWLFSPLYLLLTLNSLSTIISYLDLGCQIYHSHNGNPQTKQTHTAAISRDLETVHIEEKLSYNNFHGNGGTPEEFKDVRQFIGEFTSIFMRLLKNLVVTFFLFLIVSWNAGNMGNTSMSTPNNLKWLMWLTHLDQSWSMFAPRPPDVGWWYNIEGRLDDDTHVELFDNAALFTHVPNIPHSFAKPDPFYVPFKNHRWFKFFENGINSHPQNEQLRLHFGRWICREYNARARTDKERLYTFTIWWMGERYFPLQQDRPREPLAKQALWNHRCYDK